MRSNTDERIDQSSAAEYIKQDTIKSALMNLVSTAFLIPRVVVLIVQGSVCRGVVKESVSDGR